MFKLQIDTINLGKLCIYEYIIIYYFIFVLVPKHNKKVGKEDRNQENKY